MTTTKEKLGRLTLESPCPQSWDGMEGDPARRYCLHCDRAVHDLGSLSPREIAVLIEASRGRLCARITRDAYGRLVTGELVTPQLSPTTSPLRASPLAAALVGGFLVLGGSAAASPPPAGVPAAVPGSPDVRPEAVPRPVPTPPGTARLTGRIVDADGLPLPGTTVTIGPPHEIEGPRGAIADRDGRFSFVGLIPGTYEIEVYLSGFAFPPVPPLELSGSREVKLEVKAAPLDLETVAVGGASVQASPLHREFELSELVVLATAGPSTVLAGDEYFGEVATEIVIRSTFKGKAPGRSVRLFHGEAGSAAQRKTSLPPGTPVLAFLVPRDGEGGRLAGYESADFHFGLKSGLSAAELEAYGERLTALAPIYRYGEPQSAELVEWLVATAENPWTRSEVIGELGRADLSGEQKERLWTAFQETPRLSFAEVALFGLVRSWMGDAALPWLADRIEKAAPQPGLAVLQSLAYQAGDDALLALVAAADREIGAYGESLGELSEAKVRLYDARYAEVEAALRQRFVETLTGMPSPSPEAK